MEKDTVIVLDDADNVIGSESKRGSHEFTAKQPRGVLHRAFSVFIFDQSTGELLLQKRASTKITFPNVWTNTCCSHPLHGMSPNEVDRPQDVEDGSVVGAKNAAVRKLEHELGIPKEEVPVEGFKFLTRLHYWAADTVTHGPESPWGEHEIDYVLFFTVESKDQLTIEPHPDEVDDVCWVTKQKLLAMFDDKSLLFSPWFRIIAHRWMLSKDGWWDDLAATMTTHRHCDYATIHEFDPPAEHMGGQGAATALFSPITPTQNAVAKQGAYGKIKTHTESKLSQLARLDEVCSAATLLYIQPLKSNLHHAHIKSTFNKDDLAFCDEILCKVSRSFAAVIRQLPPTLLVDVLIFYLVLRALDTIEDDMTAFPDNKTKIDHLLSFHKTALMDPTWSMDGVGEGHEKLLLQQFPKCHSVYAALSQQSRRVIADISHRMATGMAEFVGKDLGQGTLDITQYNRYCHFVAGLVGEGLSRLFAVSGLESPSMAKELHLSDQMGLFLQKTNIIRDYLEDYVDGRAFWPQSVWNKYSTSGDLGYFANQSDPLAQTKSLHCLNELVTDALSLVPDCLAYLAKLRCTEVFRFCAIPQVMAIATLDKCFNNPNVFTGVVKIRKGLSCQLILHTNDAQGVHAAFRHFANSIASKINPNDPNADATLKACDAILEITAEQHSRATKQKRTGLLMGTAAAAAAVAATSSRSSSKNLIPSLALSATAFIGSFWVTHTFQRLVVKGSSSGSLYSPVLRPAAKLMTECQNGDGALEQAQ
uniref:Nudix hydrolase domain-containing protein n=1 Tax=Ditylum brightwellii TaxID=49249 RepID=A0A7S4T082_9STRA